MKPELTSLEIAIIVLSTQATDPYVIGAKKGLSYGAVKFHISSIYRKLGFPKVGGGTNTNMVRLTHYAIQNGFIQAGQCV